MKDGWEGHHSYLDGNPTTFETDSVRRGPKQQMIGCCETAGPTGEMLAASKSGTWF